MSDHKTSQFEDRNWALRVRDDGGIARWEEVHFALLMDIRRELRKLNNTLSCSNFTGIPRTLRQIDRRLAKSVPLRARRPRKTP